ncbi:MAG: hypothetical protein EOM67_13435, partial [Spirochaetia bacterium]|nr:hypothetical protein [Spirochaetia bacterium]
MKSSSLKILIIYVLLLSSCSLPEQENSLYLTQVFEYVYGVGQHVSLATDGVEELLVGVSHSYVVLGGWGGYIVAGFDHDVINTTGMYDFGIYTQEGTGDEPAVIFVMQDENNNNLPDDSWYEIKGSETDRDGYERNATITYYKPENLDDNIRYRLSNESTVHELVNGSGTTGSWWWPYYDSINADEHHAITTGVDSNGSFITFQGTLLPPSKEYKDGQWKDIPDIFTYGYGENYSGLDCQSIPYGRTTRRANLFNIEDAIDEEGQSVT